MRLAGSQPAVQVDDLWFRYEAGPWVLKGIELVVDAGDFLAIIGQNGSGKTTLVKHFNGLCRPERGRVRIAGRDTAGRPVGELAKTVGYVFQNPDHQIFATTVWDEIAFGLRALKYSREEVRGRTAEALARFQLQEYREAPPAILGYGLRRQVTVAAVWAARPEILVLDEPTTGLDLLGTRELMAALRELNAAGSRQCDPHTVIFITHKMKLVAEFAQTVAVMRGGEIVSCGPTREVFARESLLRRTGLAVPPITSLSRRMSAQGMTGSSLTVEEFCREYRALESGERQASAAAFRPGGEEPDA